MELKFRPAKTQYLMTPPASESSESMDVDEEAPEMMQVDKPEHAVFQFSAGSAQGEPLHLNQPAFRRRIGRLNRLWIDRRGLSVSKRTEPDDQSDRWKYDSDDEDDEPPVYEVDPFDTRALRFRSTIPLNPYVFRGRPPIPPDVANGNQAVTQKALQMSQTAQPGQSATPPRAPSASIQGQAQPPTPAQTAVMSQAQTQAQAQVQAQAPIKAPAQVQAQAAS
jgi:enhancer of polycomb-like protein